MGLFTKKNLYKIVWAWHDPGYYSYTEIVKARDAAHAWSKIKRKHFSDISLISLEEIK